MLKPGDTFERYTIEDSIGQGGMGTVYRAHDARLDRRVALKVLSEEAASAETNARLLREARMAAALDHPNAVAIFDVGEHQGAPYIVMELVAGRTLRAEVGAGASLATKLAWLADVARALAAAHRRGLVHRDVKPENVMVRADGVVKVLDFGIARRASGDVDPTGHTQTPALPTLTVTGAMLGTPVYMAPEQIRGDALDGRADQFAWGVLAHELLTGKLPWRGASDALAVLASILTDPVEPEALERASVPPAAREIVLRALSKRPADRFASMDDVARALDAIARGEAPSAPPPPRADGVKPAPAPASGPAPARPPVQSPTLAARYSTAEVREILARAIEQQEKEKADDRLGFDDLLAAAREVGVDAEVLREASRELRARGEVVRKSEGDAQERDAWLRRQRRAFYRHFGVYVIVMTALQLIGLITGAFPYTLIPAIGWAIGVAIHGMNALTTNEDDWARVRARRQRRERWAQHGEAVAQRAIEEGAALVLKHGRSLRHGHPALPAPAPRVRVDLDATRREREREEAELEREALRPGRRRRGG